VETVSVAVESIGATLAARRTDFGTNCDFPTIPDLLDNGKSAGFKAALVGKCMYFLTLESILAKGAVQGTVDKPRRLFGGCWVLLVFSIVSELMVKAGTSDIVVDFTALEGVLSATGTAVSKDSFLAETLVSKFLPLPLTTSA
jgi:hypothetical protein